MSDSTIQASAPGKLILLGEYAVLEEAPCLVAAVDRSCDVQINPLSGKTSRIVASNPDIPDIQFTLSDEGEMRFKNDLSSENRERLRFVISTLKYVIQQNDKTFSAAAIKIDTQKFYHKTGHKLGLGASAAITVSLLSALMKYINKPVSGRGLYREAYRIHRKAQGKLGSGTDIAASAIGGVMQYRMQKNGHEVDGILEPTAWPQDLQMIPIWAGYSASTQDMVRKVRLYRDENSSSYEAIMEPMRKLSSDGCNAFRRGDVDGFLEVVADFVRCEQKLGEASQTDIISKAHKEILTLVEDAGGVYKPSGAGRGDIGVAFCTDLETRLSITDAIENSNFDRLELALQIDEIKTATLYEADSR
ncbi:MAG TPA: hypothetical protein VFG39_07390 [Balneolaceae bacterium]|nr:hypothetical protein [Balneolaceae bacterium]